MSSLLVILDVIKKKRFEDIPVSVLLHPREPLTLPSESWPFPPLLVIKKYISTNLVNFESCISGIKSYAFNLFVKLKMCY